MADFHNECADLGGINRAYMVVLPKKEATYNLKDFRPISLQNCLSKVVTKCMTNRLQPLLPQLEHSDQTSFLKGRCIAENFIYATKLVQCCHKRRFPALVLKLDFRKALLTNSDHIINSRGQRYHNNKTSL